MKRLKLAVAAVTMLAPAFALAAAHPEQKEPETQNWAFEGPFGVVDRQSAQRGFQVYKEVCSACHSLKRVPFRALEELGFSEGEVKALAAGYSVNDGPDDSGEMFTRPGRPSDYIPGPHANDNAARAANNGALPPDLSLIIKARHDGANYVYSLLTGYHEAPADMVMNPGMNYNPYFPGSQIAMPQPLSAGAVTYEDGTNNSVEQMSKDVVTFLQWAAEPEMEQRKSMGIKVLLYLAIFTAFAFIAKRRVWKNLH